jgi:hypothetical protein
MNGQATYQGDAADLERRTRNFWDRIFGGLNIRGEYERTLLEGQAIEIALLQALLAKSGGSAAAAAGTVTSATSLATTGTTGAFLAGVPQPTAAVQIELPVATVGPGSSPTALVMLLGQPPGPVNMSSGEAQSLVGARLVFLGGAMAGQVRSVAAVGTDGTLTPDAPYTSAPQQGMQFVLIPTSASATVQATNLAEVGGVAQTGANWTALFSSPDATLTTNEQVTVGTSAARLDTAPAGRRSAIVFNNNASGGAVLYVGGANTVTTASGYPVPAQAALALNIGPNLAIYGISTASVDARVLELA